MEPPLAPAGEDVPVAPPPLLGTTIHRALGETGPLDYDMICRAVEAGLSEDETLDWKGSEYRDIPGKDAGDEFAKDVAAFANTRGGLIVLGVSEDRKTGRAQKVTPIEITDALTRRMRSWLYPRLSPTLPGLTFHPLRRQGSDTAGILVVSVPPSPDMPHMIGNKNSCGFPYRDGEQTNWMREFDLERAYRDRFARRETDEVALARLITEASDLLNLESMRWLVGAARPTLLSPATAQPMSVETIRQVMTQVETRHNEIRSSEARCPKTFSAHDSHILNPRVGLRRWVMTNTANHGDPAALAEAVHIEIHHDGSVVLAVAANPWGEGNLPDKDVLSDASLSGMAVAFTNLVATLNEQSASRSDYVVRVDLVGGGHPTCGFVMPTRVGPISMGAEQPSWSRDVRRFHPVETVFPHPEGVEQRRALSRQVVTDVAAQFGVRDGDFGWGD